MPALVISHRFALSLLPFSFSRSYVYPKVSLNPLPQRTCFSLKIPLILCISPYYASAQGSSISTPPLVKFAYRFNVVSMIPMSNHNSPGVTPSTEGDQSYFREWTPHVWESSRPGYRSPTTTPESPNTIILRRRINGMNRPPLRTRRSKTSNYTGSSTDSLSLQASRAYSINPQALDIAPSSRNSITPANIRLTTAASTATSSLGSRRFPNPEASIKAVKIGELIEMGSATRFEDSGGSSEYLDRRAQRSEKNGSSEATDSTIKESKKTRRESYTDQDLDTRNTEPQNPETSQAGSEAATFPRNILVKACRASQKYKSTKSKFPRASLASKSQKANNQQDKSNQARNKEIAQPESLYARTKRAFKSKGCTSPTSKRTVLESATITHSVTAQLLERASTLLKQVTERNKGARLTDSSSVSNKSNPSIAATHNRAGRYTYSSSSSFKIIEQAKSLPTTPESESLYTGSDGNKYLRPDMSRPDAPKYLPSEARRVHTPPLPSDDAGNLRRRGFFFDYNAPTEDGDPVAPRASKRPSKRLGSDVDGIWFRVTPSEEDVAELNAFVMSMPDHLPSSPLCPRHPKHKLGGGSVCMIHG